MQSLTRISPQKVVYKEMEHYRTESKVRERSAYMREYVKSLRNLTKGTRLSGDTSLNSSLLSGFTCERNDAVSTNCPTVLPNLQMNMKSEQTSWLKWYCTPRQECIIRKVADENAIEKLCYPRKHQKKQKWVDKLQSFWRVVIVCFPQALYSGRGCCSFGGHPWRW